MTLYVGRIAAKTTEADLKALFAPHGVTSAVVMRDGTTKESRGFGFIEIDGDAKTAILALNGSEFMGKEIVVAIAT